jgi:hypothetical protein
MTSLFLSRPPEVSSAHLPTLFQAGPDSGRRFLISWEVAVAIALFLMAQPQRRVRATLGKDRITLASLDDICNPPEEFGSRLLVH